MTDEIVFEKLPNGFTLAKKLTSLRLFVEHQLLTMATRDWVLNQKDSTWQAVCHYYALVMQVNVQTNRAYAPPQPCVSQVSSGALIVGFNYPFSWRLCDYYSASLEPCLLLAGITDCIHFYGEPQGGGDFPLPLTGFDRHLAKTNPANVLHLTTRHTIDGDTVLALDDGRFTSGIRPGDHLPNWTDQQDYDRLTRRVWKRWFRDSVLGIGLRDVVAPDGQVVVSTTAMTSFLQGRSLSFEHCFLVLLAVANGYWDSKLAEFAFTRLLEVEVKSPNSIDGFVKALPDVVAALLPPALKAYRL